MHPVIFIMGVAGSGKTVTGQHLSHLSGIPFFDADDYHPVSNKEKMKAGIPLTDDDRYGWLQQLSNIAKSEQQKCGAIITCSALKEKYRKQLSDGVVNVSFVYLKGSFEFIEKRLQQRTGHFMPPGLLQSQFDILEEPADALVIDIEKNNDPAVNIFIKLKMKSAFGVIGLGVMGKSIARNLAAKGISLSLYNRFVPGKEESVAKNFIAAYPELKLSEGFESLEEFSKSLSVPRRILLMVNAGEPVDDILKQLKPFLSPGDIVIDGGNSWFRDTERRQTELITEKIHFIGAGISGGEKGALTGASIMLGGNEEASKSISSIFESAAAKNKQGHPCCAYISGGGSGHFVKMVHNAIEYAEMQLLCEVYDLLRNGLSLSSEAVAEIFERWDKADTGSYLLGITAEILRKKENEELLLDKISDSAQSKGTGAWSLNSANESGIPFGMASAAVYARFISAMKKERTLAAEILGAKLKSVQSLSEEELLNAYQLARIINHHQGFELIRKTASEKKWRINFSQLAAVWTNGCIIRSTLMEKISECFRHSESLLLSTGLSDFILKTKPHLTSVTAKAIEAGFAVPSLTEALNYLNAIARLNSTANLVQAQRDYFGSHGYKRNDDPEGKIVHTNWE